MSRFYRWCYVILVVEGLADAVTTYIAIRRGFREVHVVFSPIWHMFGTEGLIASIVAWAFIRIYILERMRKDTPGCIMKSFLIVLVLGVAYSSVHNLLAILLCQDPNSCVLPLPP